MKTILYISCIEMHGIHAVLCISELYTMLIKYVLLCLHMTNSVNHVTLNCFEMCIDVFTL